MVELRVCCRYVSQQRYSEAVDLLRDGALSLLRANQISSGADLGLLLVNTLDKAGAPITDKNIGNIVKAIFQRHAMQCNTSSASIFMQARKCVLLS